MKKIKLPPLRYPRRTEGNVIGDDLSPTPHCCTKDRPFALPEDPCPGR